MARLAEEAAGRWQNGRDIDLHREMMRLTLAIPADATPEHGNRSAGGRDRLCKSPWPPIRGSSCVELPNLDDLKAEVKDRPDLKEQLKELRECAEEGVRHVAEAV